MDKWDVYTRPKTPERKAKMEVQVENTIVLSVGDWHHLGMGKDRIAYAGMPSEKVFSMVARKWEFFYRGFAWNLFFPKGQREIRVDGVNLIVESVNPEQIVLRG